MNIIASGNKVEMSGINIGQVNEFVEYVRNNIGKKSESTSIQSSPDVSDDLRKFKALMEDGIISEEDFIEKKKQLLGI
ncbi:SHOCT domain-containing protein [Paenisporosarcina sp. OV554]|uniref:SHOCT domain-containing protein n=1 Tax=Paenisporosarcina sp. OV554 TaxID=2135694 RepID=UPI0018EE66AA|nr:SHOCT domain-containing protein [Paenisporosarcina sp. OV554]